MMIIIIIVLINKMIKGNNNIKKIFLFSKMDYHLQLIMLKIINLINVYNYLNHNKSFKHKIMYPFLTEVKYLNHINNNKAKKVY